MRGRLDHENSWRNAINLGNKAASQRNLNFKEAEFNGVRLKNDQISAKEIVETYEGYLNHLLEVYGYQEGSDEYEVLKLYLFWVKWERVLREILSFDDELGSYWISEGEIKTQAWFSYVKPEIKLNTSRIKSKEEFFYVLFHEMVHTIYNEHIVHILANQSSTEENGGSRLSPTDAVAILWTQDAQFCGEFFARIHTTNLMLNNNADRTLIDAKGTGATGASSGEDRYTDAIKCAVDYEKAISRHRDQCMDAVKRGERSLEDAVPKYWKFYNDLNEELFRCISQKEINDVLILFRQDSIASQWREKCMEAVRHSGRSQGEAEECFEMFCGALSGALLGCSTQEEFDTVFTAAELSVEQFNPYPS